MWEREGGEGGRERYLVDLIIYLSVSVLTGKTIASFIISWDRKVSRKPWPWESIFRIYGIFFSFIFAWSAHHDGIQLFLFYFSFQKVLWGILRTSCFGLRQGAEIRNCHFWEDAGNFQRETEIFGCLFDSALHSSHHLDLLICWELWR